jgi:mono/diheme cytochrome c family protein
MPPYRSLFDGAADWPRQSARDLVAYLQILGQARELAGPEGEAKARAGCNCPDDEMAQMAFTAPALNASPARPRRGGDVPALAYDGDRTRGQMLYAARCESCHGPRGAGDGPGAAALLPRPANLAEHEYSLARLSDALWNGVAGTAMQAWRDHPAQDLAAIAAVVRGFHTPQPVTLPASMVELGQRVYAANCVQCHGVDGGGNGSAAAELPMAPTNFRQQRPSLGLSLRSVRNGVEGTRMASWTGRLNEAEIVAVSNYVRSFFQPDATTGGGPR